ncbi:hypothetical protein CLOM_g24273 [Closterium sp. NIES-68]|nr:hypothetical protein CLOM_g24273 [Closterium sp. NIES-68]GJP59308.1 hypothetical protein CLOP_g10242 [Closterium sp. NIES-67]GJP83059.1 hypothetical protein CLOP_g13265 [Closterium sp. NIES-67]
MANQRIFESTDQRNQRRTFFVLVCLAFSLLLSPGHSAAQNVYSAKNNTLHVTNTIGSTTTNEDVRPLEVAVRAAAAADAEAAEALAEYEDAKKVLAAKRLEAEGLRADLSAARHRAEETKIARIAVDVDTAQIVVRASNRPVDVKRAEEVAEQATAFAAETRMVADKAAAAAEKAAQLAEAAVTEEAQLDLLRAETTRAEAAQVAAVAEKLADAAKDSADEIREVYRRAESEREISTVELDPEQAYLESLESAVTRMEEEYTKGVIAVNVAEAKVAELKGLAEGKVARAKAMRVALRKGAKGIGGDTTTATQ